jgi:hypothetical protein
MSSPVEPYKKATFKFSLIFSIIYLFFYIQGTHKDVEQFLPNNLRRISNIAEDCAEEGKKVVDAFKNVTLIIHELQLASVAKIGNAMKSSGLHN